MKKSLILMYSAALIFIAAGTVHANLVTVKFDGTINIIQDTYGDLAAAGIQNGVTQLTGTIVYDTNTLPWYTTATFAQYWSNSFALDIGSNFSWSAIGNSGNGIVVQNDRIVGSQVYDMFEDSEAGYASFGTNNVYMNALVWWKDNSLLSFNSTSLPTASDLINFNIDESFFRISGYDAAGNRAWDMSASSVSMTVVPEPSTLLLLGSGLTGLLGIRRKYRK
jgi:hypothetical protein